MPKPHTKEPSAGRRHSLPGPQIPPTPLMTPCRSALAPRVIILKFAASFCHIMGTGGRAEKWGNLPANGFASGMFVISQFLRRMGLDIKLVSNGPSRPQNDQIA